jgi:YycE-like C-terminal domain/YycE-like N-terminal domain
MERCWRSIDVSRNANCQGGSASRVRIGRIGGNSAIASALIRMMSMRPVLTLRVARPTDNLAAIAEMYELGLGLSVLAEFVDHDGVDGVILGHPGDPYHIEFTAHHAHVAGRAPTKDHLLVFYIPDPNDWEGRCARMAASGFQVVRSDNPYWDIQGRTFEDLDGYRVVLQNSAWDA